MVKGNYRWTKGTKGDYIRRKIRPIRGKTEGRGKIQKKGKTSTKILDSARTRRLWAESGKIILTGWRNVVQPAESLSLGRLGTAKATWGDPVFWNSRFFWRYGRGKGARRTKGHSPSQKRPREIFGIPTSETQKVATVESVPTGQH